MFGFFECEDSPETAHALLEAAEAWLRERGRDRMVGPMDFTTNDECGLLIEGHERPPIILSSLAPPLLPARCSRASGLEKAMDLLMWSLHISGRGRVRDAIWRMAEQRRVRARDRLPADAQARPRRRGLALPRGLQRGLGAQLGAPCR